MFGLINIGYTYNSDNFGWRRVFCMSKLNRDSWNAELYDDRHAFVSKYGKELVELLQAEKGERILDLGCGTGDLANELSEFGVDVVGVDQSEKMIEQAKRKYSYLPFYVKDAVQLDYDCEFDAVFSNAVLHWVKDAEEALQGIYRSLKAGGRFVAEFGGKGNIRKITDELERQFEREEIAFEEHFPWYYPSIGEYTTLMERTGFRVVFAAHIDRPTPLIGQDGLKKWLEMFTASMFNDVSEQKKQSILMSVEENLKNTLYVNGEWVVDYKRLRVIGLKERG